jgi:aspartate carbamoyltransferase catalytic subunit
VIEYERVKGAFRVDRELLEKAGVREDLCIMHPLPRVDELARDVDDTPYAVYFEQARNGVPIRQALLAMVLGKV